MKKEKVITSTEQPKAAIERVSFERSCLDMGWQWETERVNELDSKHWHRTIAELTKKGRQ